MWTYAYFALVLLPVLQIQVGVSVAPIPIVPVQVPGSVAENVEGINLALHKPTTQSSTLGSTQAEIERSTAGNAVDGNPDGDRDHGSCTHTDPSLEVLESWWMLDLLQEYNITDVHIVKRQDEYKCQRNFARNAGKRLTTISPSTHEGISRADCASKCTNAGGCQGFNFRDVSKTCELIEAAGESNPINTDNEWDVYFA